MVKSSSIFLLSLGFYACTSESPIDNNVYDKTLSTEDTYKVSEAEAKASVKDFLRSQSLQTRSTSISRDIQEVIDLEKSVTRSLSRTIKNLAQDFYVVTFKANQGYALVSKDKRTFPIFALLDKGNFKIEEFNNTDAQYRIELLCKGKAKEITDFNKAKAEADSLAKELPKTRSGNDEKAYYDLMHDGWQLKRIASPRLSDVKWGQTIEHPSLVLNKQGARYEDLQKTYLTRSTISRGSSKHFGCTTVAYAQVLYALRNCNGFKELKYTNGEPVRWNEMNPKKSLSPEVQRFMGWITENCSPTYFSKGTMIYNTNAKDFVRSILGNYIISRYDNCVMVEGDFDGYGTAEHKRVSEEFYANPQCFVIMTGSTGVINITNYHTFVVDGMAEFSKRIYGSGFLGTGLFRKKRWANRTLYHINAGWSGTDNGYYLYVQDVNDEFKVTGNPTTFNHNCNTSYFIIRPK